MNAFAVSFVLITISAFFMTAFSFLNAKGRKDVLMWGWLCTVASFWGTGGLIATTTVSYERAYLGWQIANIGTILCPSVFFHFVVTYCNLNRIIFINVSYLVAFLFLIINFFLKELFFGRIRFAFNQFYWIDWSKESGPLYILFYVLFLWCVVLYAFFLLGKEFTHAKGPRRNQIKYLFFASGIAWLGAHGDFLSVFKHNLYPYLNFLIPLYPIIVGYAIIQHQLMDINIVLKRSLVYSILVACVTAFYLFVIFISEKFLQGLVGYNSNVVSCLTALAMAFTFTPFKNLIQRFVDQFFFKGNPLELAEQNQQMRRELIQTEKYKNLGTFSSGVAHEIKNPLTAIKTFSEYLPQKMEDKEFLAKFARIVGKEVERVNQLVHSLLDYGKPLPTKSEEVDIHPLIQETLDILSSRLISQKVKLVTHFDGGVQNAVPLRIFVDPQQTRQILLNLFINAIEAMPSGGDLFVDTARIQDEFILTVKDTGCGISKENLKKIFNPFFTTKQTGTGLGLCVTQSILESMNGQLEIDSKVGVGTEIRVRLPLKINVPLTH